MVKRKIILLIFHLYFLNACSGQNDINKNIIDSEWIKQGEFCTDSLYFFSGQNYEEFYCEFQEKMTGDYSIVGDTVKLVEYQMSSEIMGDNPKPIPTYIWKYVFVHSDTLQKVYYEDLINDEKNIGTEITWRYIRVNEN